MFGALTDTIKSGPSVASFPGSSAQLFASPNVLVSGSTYHGKVAKHTSSLCAKSDSSVLKMLCDINSLTVLCKKKTTKKLVWYKKWKESPLITMCSQCLNNECG